MRNSECGMRNGSNAEFGMLNSELEMHVSDPFYTELGFPKSRVEHCSDGLPPEQQDMSYYTPISFEEMTAMLTSDVLDLDSFAVVKNRYSENYLELSRRLEKGISELAGCCITRAVLEKKGCTFKQLDELKLDTLSAITTYHFRKCHDALQHIKNQNYRFWMQMLDMEFRWHTLAKRLKATDDRIELIRAGKINVDRLIDQLCREKSSVSKPDAGKQKQAEPPALPPSKAISFPVMGEVVKKELAALPNNEEGKSKKEERGDNEEVRMKNEELDTLPHQQPVTGSRQPECSWQPAAQAKFAPFTREWLMEHCDDEAPLWKTAGIAENDHKTQYEFYRHLESLTRLPDMPRARQRSGPPGRA